jgi:hypothetical protein
MSAGQKIIEGLREAVAGDMARVTINGQVWVKETPLERAAPDMLAALKQIERLIAGQIGSYARASHDIARAAIAKAEGGAA